MKVKYSQCFSENMTRLLLLLVLLVAATVDARRVIRAAPKSEKTGCYIVKLEDDTSHDRFEELKKALLTESVDHHIYGVEGSVSKIIAVKIPEESLDKVQYVYVYVYTCTCTCRVMPGSQYNVRRRKACVCVYKNKIYGTYKSMDAQF